MVYSVTMCQFILSRDTLIMSDIINHILINYHLCCKGYQLYLIWWDRLWSCQIRSEQTTDIRVGWTYKQNKKIMSPSFKFSTLPWNKKVYHCYTKCMFLPTHTLICHHSILSSLLKKTIRFQITFGFVRTRIVLN